MSLLELRGLSVTLPGAAGDLPVLRGMDLSIGRGATVGLVGESGSGKSMAALAIMRLLPRGAHTTGDAAFDGIDLLHADETTLCAYRGARAGMVFQEPMTALNPLMRVSTQVAEGLRLHRNTSRRPAREAARALLARVGVADPESWPHQLSGGQRQRALIAAALICGPDLLVADEPTTALDVVVQGQILDLLADMVAERAMAMLLISHDLGVVARSTARLMVMYAGRVIEEGATATVFARMAHPYTRALFAASPHATSGSPVPIPGHMPHPLAMPRGCAFAPRCPRAQADCNTAPPALRGDPGHRVACLHPCG